MNGQTLALLEIQDRTEVHARLLTPTESASEPGIRLHPHGLYRPIKLVQ